jgi:hypothetical protein
MGVNQILCIADWLLWFLQLSIALLFCDRHGFRRCRSLAVRRRFRNNSNAGGRSGTAAGPTVSDAWQAVK